MTKNLADLSPEQRIAVAEERKLALQRHQKAKVLAAQIQIQFYWIMNERIRSPKGWNERWVNLVDDIDEPALREAVRTKVYGFIESIGGRGLPKPKK
jgi:hypothetical protein